MPPKSWRRKFRRHLKALLGVTRIADLPSTVVLWAGPSRIDGTPIMAVASCYREESENGKTGDMVQVWIGRQDMSPMDAWRSNRDDAVCPSACRHRSDNEGTCYVDLARLLAAWKAAVTLVEAGRVGFPPGILEGALVRIGMWGDPSAVPLWVWERIAAQAKGHTGYTAAWRTLDPTTWGKVIMASVGSPADALRAKSLGWRVFASSDTPADDQAFADDAGLRLCLAESDGMTCASCRGCDGTDRGAKRPSFYNPVHGAVAAARRRRAA